MLFRATSRLLSFSGFRRGRVCVPALHRHSRFDPTRESRKSIYGNGPMLPRYLRCAVEVLNFKLNTSLERRSGKARQPQVYFQWA